MMRWGFLGTGRITKRMAAAIVAVKGNSLAAIASRELRRARQWIEEAEVDSAIKNKIRAIEGYREVINDPTIDWVYIALPPSLHFEWAMASLDAGKHVLCEKPLVCSKDEADILAARAKATGRILVDSTGYPFHPRTEEARKIIGSGELGSIRRVTIACSFADILDRVDDHRGNASLGGGCLFDLGWYCVHSTLWLTGLKIEGLKTFGEKKNGVWYHVQTIAKLSNGAVAHWDCGYDAAGRKWIEIAGTEGSLICDDFLRPWNPEQPRFWVHGKSGKARAEVHGIGEFQEARLVAACNGLLTSSIEPLSTNPAATDYLYLANHSLSLALDSQDILEQIEKSLR